MKGNQATTNSRSVVDSSSLVISLLPCNRQSSGYEGYRTGVRNSSFSGGPALISFALI